MDILSGHSSGRIIYRHSALIKQLISPYQNIDTDSAEFDNEREKVTRLQNFVYLKDGTGNYLPYNFVDENERDPEDEVSLEKWTFFCNVANFEARIKVKKIKKIHYTFFDQNNRILVAVYDSKLTILFEFKVEYEVDFEMEWI